MCGCPQEKIKYVFVMQLWTVTVFELWKFLKLNAIIIYTEWPPSNYCRRSYKVLYFHSAWSIQKYGLSLICIFLCMDRIGYGFFYLFCYILTIFVFSYEEKTGKIVKAIYTFILQKAKMLWEWDCLTPCCNPRRKNPVQMDFLREEID